MHLLKRKNAGGTVRERYYVTRSDNRLELFNRLATQHLSDQVVRTSCEQKLLDELRTPMDGNVDEHRDHIK